jgi:hypothetical protein
MFDRIKHHLVAAVGAVILSATALTAAAGPIDTAAPAVYAAAQAGDALHG